MSATIEPSTAAAPLDKSSERVRSMFGEIAPRYDFLNRLLSLGIDRYWRWQTVRRVPPRGDAPILDLCTGTGDLALAYLHAARGTAAVVGADFCHPMLVLAAHKGEAAAGASSLAWLEADAQHLPFADATFQIVSVAFGLRNVADTDQGLREMARVCQPGGRVAVLEFSQPRRQPFKAVYGWYFRHVLPRIGQAIARNQRQAYYYLPESVGQFPCDEALANRMRLAGLRDIRIVPLTLGVATLYVGVR